jgi:hypothetical protein
VWLAIFIIDWAGRAPSHYGKTRAISARNADKECQLGSRTRIFFKWAGNSRARLSVRRFIGRTGARPGVTVVREYFLRNAKESMGIPRALFIGGY